MDIEDNTVWYYRGSGVKLRGIPDNKMEVRNNEFAQCSLWDTTAACNPALEQTQFGLVESGNQLGAQIGGDARSSCDFDGDGTIDPFHATGVTMWFESSRLGGRYVYLARSNASGARVQIGDRTGDGICDLTIDGTLMATDPATTVITTRTTVPPVVGITTEAAARNAIAAAGLTPGTTTYVESASRPGTVLAQSVPAGYVRPTGWTIDITVSNGRTTVPRVLNLDRTSAQTAITNAGLAVGSVSTVNNCVDPGSVQTQNPSPGVVVALDTPVNITISTCVSTGGGGGGGGGGTGGGGGGRRPPILPK
jgi:hypothetical protein